MKKRLLSLISVILLLSMLLTALASCKETPGDGPDDGNTDPDSETTDPNAPYVSTENYLPEDVYKELKKSFESSEKSGFVAFDLVNAPFISMDVATITNCRVKSITIPVMKTLAMDGDNCFRFTISTIGSSLNGMRSKCLSRHRIELPSSTYKLAPNDTPYRYIKVDLSEYDIVLGPGETLAIGDVKDTIIPAYVKNNSSSSKIARFMKMDWGQCGHFSSGASSQLAYDRDIFCFDFELEKTYENKATYDRLIADEQAMEAAFKDKVEALKNAGYKGKKLSLMGDSISTCDGVTNNTDYNLNLEPNRCYYWKTTNICDWTLTYWGRLAVALEMELCVINSWSSSKVYGGGQDENDQRDASLDNMLERADQLHQDGGTPDDPTDDVKPDVIIIYMGINDMAGSNWCDLAERLDSGLEEDVVMTEWMGEVNTRAALYFPGDKVVPGTTYTSWQASYALGVKLMKQMYPDAEIWLMNLLPINGHSSEIETKIVQANMCISAIANYFDVKVIHQKENGYINRENSYLYGHDEGTTIRSLHPNIQGHELMMRVIVDELYNNLP